MDHKFTEKIKQWLEKSEDERDYSVGALSQIEPEVSTVRLQSLTQISNNEIYLDTTTPSLFRYCRMFRQ